MATKLEITTVVPDDVAEDIVQFLDEKLSTQKIRWSCHEEEAAFYIHKHEVALQYGGPEEGGWWYDSGVPVKDWQVVRFEDEEAAYAACRALNCEEDERAKSEEDYEYTSVLAGRSTHYAYSVEEYPIPRAYPEVRPHYE